jgi:flagellar FliJ protein
MKQFKWKLQRLLDIRAKQERLKKVELFEITEKLSAVKTELMMQKNILKDMLDSLSKESPDTRLVRQAMFMASSARNNEIIKNLETKQTDLQSQHKEKMAEVLKIRQFRQGLEKLREEAKINFITEEEKKEQNEMNEASTSRFAQNILSQQQISLTV